MAAADHEPPGERGPMSMRDIVLAQAREQVGIPVSLFATDSLAEAGASTEPGTSLDPGGVGDGGDDSVAAVAAVAARVGVELDDLVLFSAEAYLLQVALGAQVLPERA